jgi:hypothetical protein
MTALSPFDVLCGRSSESYGHEGNQRFREIVRQHRDGYREASRRSDKSAITRAVIGEVHDAGGRFLKLDARGSGWLPLESGGVYEKVSHALRGSKPPAAAAASPSSGKAKEEKPPAQKTRHRKSRKRAPRRRSTPLRATDPSGAAESRERQASFNQTLERQQSLFRTLLQRQEMAEEQADSSGVAKGLDGDTQETQGRGPAERVRAGECSTSVADSVQLALDVDSETCDFDLFESELSPRRDE